MSCFFYQKCPQYEGQKSIFKELFQLCEWLLKSGEYRRIEREKGEDTIRGMP